MGIRKFKIFKKITSIALASALVASQVILPQTPVAEHVFNSSVSVKAAATTVDDCDYVYTVGANIGGIIVNEETDQKEQYVLDISDIPANATIEQVMIQVSTGSSQELAMIAIGAHVVGYNEDDWYSDSGQDTGDKLTFTYNIPKEVASVYGKDFTELYIQHWWGNGDQVVKVDKVGINVAGGAASAVPGDFDGDKKVQPADLVLFTQYMTGAVKSDFYDIVADYNSDGKVNIVDYIMMKNKFVKAAEGSQIGNNGQTALEFVENITVGWNLGNSLDSTCDWITNPTPEQFEKAWTNPVTTKSMIDAVKAMGFNTVRVPVSWGQKMGPAPDYTVSAEWMNRVNEVVDYVIDNDMYCILNVHHDNDWVVPTYAAYDGAADKLTKLWTQISKRFEKYDEHLIFETLNEPRLVGTDLEWSGGNHEARDCINKLNAKAVDAIRQTGGNNKLRFLMCPTYAASGSSATVNDYVAPDDDRVIVSIHAYSPYYFALANSSVAGSTDKFNDSDKAGLRSDFQLLYNKFISQGRAVIIGEFGAQNKNNEADRARWAEYYVSTAKSFGMRCVWWDNNCFEGDGEKFGLLRRSSLENVYPEIVKALFKGLNS